MNTLENLEQRLVELAEAQIDQKRKKFSLEYARADAITAPGGVLGKNADEREANLILTLREQYSALENAERALIWAKTHVEIARLRHEGASIQMPEAEKG